MLVFSGRASDNDGMMSRPIFCSFLHRCFGCPPLRALRAVRVLFVLLALLPVLLVLLLTFSTPARAQQLELALESIQHPAFAAQQVTVQLLPSGAATLTVGRLHFAERTLGPLRLYCGRLFWSAAQARCQAGQLLLPAPSHDTAAAPGPGLPLEFSWQAASKRLTLNLQQAELSTLAPLLPELAAWHPRGRVDLQAQLDERQIKLQANLQQVAFADESGLHAAENIAADITLSARRAGSGKDAWHWQGRIDWPQGELFLAPLYRAGGLQLAATGRLTAQDWLIDQANLQLDDIGQLSGSLHWQPVTTADAQFAGRLLAAELQTGALDLAQLIAQFVQPFIDAQAGTQLTAAGHGRLALSMDAQGLAHVDLDLQDASLGSGQYALQGVQAQIPWQRDAATSGRVDVQGGHLGLLELGSFTADLGMHGYGFDLPTLAIPLLDGRLLFENIHARRVSKATETTENSALAENKNTPTDGLEALADNMNFSDNWQWHLGLALEPVSMPLLTEALGWPKMSGLVSASIPRISYVDQTLVLDGQLMVAVFDGYLAVDELRLIEPFGSLPRLQANIEARHLDLQMLTETFSFGSVTGYVDADVQKLEMAGMRPLAFNASIVSSPGNYPKRISQRAVQNISSLGGAGAAAAIQRSFLQFFESFGYDSMGLRCRLRGGICRMAGIDAPLRRLDRLARRLSNPGSDGSLPSQGYELIRGGGIPGLNVIGYNRRVDWEELVSRLQAVIAGNHAIEVR